jgi:hypothetical protein
MKAFIPDSVIRRAEKDGVKLSRGLVTIVRPNPRLHIPMPAGADFEEWVRAEAVAIGHECEDCTQEDIDDYGSPSEWCPGCMFRSEMQWRWDVRQSLLHPPPPPPPRPTDAELAAAAAVRKAAEQAAFAKWYREMNPFLKTWFDTGDKKERRFIYESEFLGYQHGWMGMLDILDPDWEAKCHAASHAKCEAERLEREAREAAVAAAKAAEEAARPPPPPGHPLFGTASPHEWIHTARNKDVEELVADFNAWQSTPKNKRPIWCGVGHRTLPGKASGGEGNVSMRVSNVSDKIRLWDVREFAAAAGGRVRDVFHPAPGGTKKPFLFVEFLTEEECERAVATLSAAPVILYGRELKFEVSVNSKRGAPATDRPPRPAAATTGGAAPAPAPAPRPAPRPAPAPAPRAAPRRGGFAALAGDSDSE